MRDSPESEKSSSPTNSAKITINDYRTAYERADKFCKEVQNYIEEAGIPAMNEMRYAGHHLLQSLNDNGGIADDAQLAKAYNHALRAAYEASEAGILAALDEIAYFKTTYKNVVFSEVVANYTEILNDAEDAKDRIEIRKNTGGQMVAELEEYMSLFSKLKKHTKILNIHRDELNKKRRSANWGMRQFAILAALACGTLIIAAFAWLHPFAPYEGHNDKTVADSSSTASQ